MSTVGGNEDSQSTENDEDPLLLVDEQGEENIIITRIRNGEISAFDLLYTTYFPRLLEFSYRYLRSREAAEDVVQETMFSIWKGRENLNIQGNIAPYLYGAVRNRCLQIGRHLGIVQRFEQTADEGDGTLNSHSYAPDTSITAESERAVVRSAISLLSDSQKRVLLLKWQDDLSGEEIAQILGISREAAWKQIQRAENSLKALLDGKI